MLIHRVRIQQDKMDCGPFCLLYLSEFFGRTFDIELLRNECGSSSGGVSMLALNQAATKLGYETHALKSDYETLTDTISLPCIAFVDGDHFIVILKIGKNHIKVYDPAIGICKITKKEFSQRWLLLENSFGYVLTCTPLPNFYAYGATSLKKRERLLGTVKNLSQYKGLIAKIIIGLFLGSILQLLFPILTQQIVDIGINGKDTNILLLILIGQIVLVISGIIVDFIEGWIVLFVGARINIKLVYEFLCKLIKLPICFFDARQSGDIFQRISDQQRIEHFLMETLLEIILAVLNFIIFSIVVYMYSSTIFFIILIGNVLYLFWITIFLKKRRRLDYNLFANLTDTQDCIIELVRGMQEIKLCNCYETKMLNWLNVQKKLYTTRVENLKLGQLQSVGTTFVSEISNAVVLFVSASYVISGNITLGTMLAIQYIVGQMSSPIHKSVALIHEIQDAKIAMERLDTINQSKVENRLVSHKKQTSFQKNKSDILFENVSFSYNKDDGEILKNINLNIERGKVTAIVGLSGSGKTTLLKLILGFYQPTNGRIIVNGYDLSTIDIDQWRTQCGVVMQDGYVFSDSIAANIAPKETHIDNKKLSEVLKITNLDSFIESLPLKSKTKVGTNGHGLSIGQRQRLLIARALYKNPDILLLDEATNSLDTKNESQIWDRMSDIFRNKTVLVIAHRLSTIKFADKIVVLDKGMVKEIGTHQELLNIQGYYFDLVNSQLL